MSIRIPRRVLISETASAPSASTAFAIATISVTLGLSLTISGLLVAPRTAFVTAAAIWGVEPKAAPPSLTLGQEMFSSIMSTAVPSSFWAMVMQSSTVEAGDIGEDCDVLRPQVRKLVFDKGIDTGILQANRVQHPRRRLGNPGRWVSVL